MNRLIFLLALLTGCPFLLTGQKKDMIFQALQSRDGLTYSAVRDIKQDKKGYIWIATLKGLNRFDGYNITQYYQSEEGLPSNCIEALLTIGNDLLIGTDEGLCLYNDMSESFTRIPVTNETTLSVTGLLDQGNGSYLIAAEQGLFLYTIQEHQLQLLYPEPVTRVEKDNSGNIWGFNTDGVFTFHENGFLKRKIEVSSIKPDTTMEITSLYIDSQGTVWMGTSENGLYRFNERLNNFIPADITGQDHSVMRFVRCMMEDLLGNLWIGTENGLFIYNYNDQQVKHYKDSKALNTGNINDNAIYCLFRSREGIIWIGTFFGGVNYVNTRDHDFNYMLSGDGVPLLRNHAVSNIIKDSKGNMWFASENKGILIYDPVTGNSKTLDKETKPALAGDNVHALAEDPYGYIWAGNFIDGLHRINPASGQIKYYKNRSGATNELTHNSIYKLFICNEDSMIIGTFQGAGVYYFKADTFSRFLPEIIKDARIDDIVQDQQNNLWLAAHFDGIFRYNMETGEAKQYKRSVPGYENIVSNNTYCCFQDSKGRIWFGTSNGGLMLYQSVTDSFLVTGHEDALLQRDIYAIEEDSFGMLWLSTDNGLFSYDPETGQFSSYSISNQIMSNQFNASSGYKDENGTIYFGSINGVCYFQPEEIRYDTSPDVHIIFSGFSLFNRPVQPGAGSILAESIDHTDKIKLKHDQNSVTFDFMAINHTPNHPAFYHWEWYLKGIDTRWNTAGHTPQSVTYNNLDAGEYTLFVQLVTQKGIVLDRRQIDLTIKPHFLLSGSMISLYCLIVGIISYLLIRTYRNRLKDRMEIQIERIEKNNLKELNQHKLNFFTYISHEFKTPLFILMALFEDISKHKQQVVSPEDEGIILRNIQRLLFLIDQLMEFRSIESDHRAIEYVKGDIIHFCREIFELFQPVFKQNQIEYNFGTDCESCIIPFDSDKLEKIISNLLSNAFKHTKPGGQISLKLALSEDKEEFLFVTHNSGSYIPPEQQKAILQPFYMSPGKNRKYANSGVGLALVSGLVEVLSGRIEIESSSLHGTAFRVHIPIPKLSGTQDIQPSKLSIHNTYGILEDTIYMFNSTEADKQLAYEQREKKFTVLLVEDNHDINKLLKNNLCRTYKVKTAYNGAEAMQILENHLVDIIISDIMMPRIDGYELCSMIRENRAYAHIPIILITSQTSKESEIKGLNIGADAYLQKPFTFEELNLRIHNLLRIKDDLRDYYQEMNMIETDAELNNKEELFIKSLTDFIIRNIQNQDLNVDDLAKHANISRTLLYNKLKKTVNMSATEFVNKVRIEVAKKKITENKQTLAEISWELGFNTPSYFTKMFKRFCGMTPNEYKKGKQSKENSEEDSPAKD